MRNLSRIIFINSANIPYSDNIYLDGNIHFIGTQGVGKSTILRAILFFYNADTQKLGIPVEKQNYTDYYFPFANSFGFLTSSKTFPFANSAASSCH